MFVTAYAAAELVEVAQAEAVGAVNDDGVGVGDVGAALEDGGGEEDVGFAIDKFGHDFFEVVAMHLAMADDDAGVGQEGLELFGHGVNGHDAVVEEEDLAAAVEFAADGVADDALVVLG